MPATTVKPIDFRTIWTNALCDFCKSTNVDLIENPAIFHPTDVDDLIRQLKEEHLEFGHDTRSSKFTNVIKSAIGPFNFLTATAGSSAAQVRHL
jgi:Cys-tRNA synthase (O-phospho-L-seryl-tRNA:Cys-tRNA synthase)